MQPNHQPTFLIKVIKVGLQMMLAKLLFFSSFPSLPKLIGDEKKIFLFFSNVTFYFTWNAFIRVTHLVWLSFVPIFIGI